MQPLKVAVLGASGYTGADIIRLAITHPQMQLMQLIAERRAGNAAADVWPHMAAYDLPDFISVGEADLSPEAVDVIFCCLPHATSQRIIKNHIDGQGGYAAYAATGQVIIDLSADFRLRDTATYAQWYGGEHLAPELQTMAVYGLSEHYAGALKSAALIACPGCYPTAALLALKPLVAAGLIDVSDINIDAKSGVSGAGRGAKEANLFTEMAEAIHPYGLGKHRHMPEIEQELAASANMAADDLRIGFTPHLIPMNRGELETITVKLANSSLADLRARLVDFYTDEPFVHILPQGKAAATRMVRGSNHAVISLHEDRRPGTAIVVVAIDNLVKGSSGQAIQNMNIRFGLPSIMGLEAPALFP